MAATIIICVLLAGAFAYGVYSIRGRLTHGCCGAGGDVPRVRKPRDRDPAHYPYVYLIGVGGMTCGNCAKRVESKLYEHGGLLARVDLGRGEAIVLSREEIPEEALALLVTRAGYQPAGIRRLPGADAAQTLRAWKKGDLGAA